MTTRLQRLRRLGCTGQAEGSENFEEFLVMTGKRTLMMQFWTGQAQTEKAWRISFQAMVRLRALMKQFLGQAKLEPEKLGNALLAEGEAREALQNVLVDDDTTVGTDGQKQPRG